MIEALLQGKLSNEQENMEDLLTSMVFGSFRRMSVEQGLLPFLRESEEITGIRPLTQNNKLYSAEYGRYEFWPSWQGFDNVDSCEPDVVIKLDAGNEKNILVLIEAKYHSGVSSTSSEGATVTHQIAKEWLHLAREANKRDCIPWLIYLTTDMGKSAPKKEIDEAQKEIKEKCNTDVSKLTISWLSWRVLSKLFKDRTTTSIQFCAMKDIGNLAVRLNLVYFEGDYPVSEPPELKYNFSTIFKWDYHTQCTTKWRFINDR